MPDRACKAQVDLFIVVWVSWGGLRWELTIPVTFTCCGLNKINSFLETQIRKEKKKRIILASADGFQVDKNKAGRRQEMSVKGPVRASMLNTHPFVGARDYGEQNSRKVRRETALSQPQEIAPGRLIHPSCTVSQTGCVVQSFMHTWAHPSASPPPPPPPTQARRSPVAWRVVTGSCT